MSSPQPSIFSPGPGAGLAIPVEEVRPCCFDGLKTLVRHLPVKIAQWIIVSLLFAFTTSATMAAYGADITDGSIAEYQLKAAFLYNFAKFVQWPTEASGGASAPFTLCVSGDEPFRIMHQYLAGKKVRGQPIAVRAVDSSAGASGCHLLFVSAASVQLQQALSRVSGPVLTVGESGDFIHSGGMINLVRSDNRLRFEVSRSVGERAGLKFSSQLLKLATAAGESLGGP